MCIPRTSVLFIEGPAELPEGSREAAERHAKRLEIDLRWQDAADGAAIAAQLQQATGSDQAIVLASGPLACSRELAAAIAACRAAATTVVHVDAARRSHLDVVHEACDLSIHGRGRRSLRAALDWLSAERALPSMAIGYGEHPEQVGDLRLPNSSEVAPVAVLLHGGFWLDPWERDQMARLAVAMTREGWATWNVGYRRLGRTGGGWPHTLEDACAALDIVADLAAAHPVDPTRTVVLGHSAGAQLGIYAATRGRSPGAAPGAPPRVAPIGIVSLAGVLDLPSAADDDLGDGAVVSLLGASSVHPERYEAASPTARVPVEIPMLMLHGRADRMVPPSQTESFVAAANAAGDEVIDLRLDAPHLDIIDPDGTAMEPIRAWLRDRATR